MTTTQTHITAGHQAAPRQHADCGLVAYPWSLGIRSITTTVMNDFAKTSKVTRRRKESSP